MFINLYIWGFGWLTKTFSMNKSDLINRVFEDTNYSKSEITEIVNATFEALSFALKEGKKVTIKDFGTFSVTSRAPRLAINPKTMEKVQVGKRNRIKFKSGKELLKSIND